MQFFILSLHWKYTIRILSWWAEPIHIWIWMPNMKNFTMNKYDVLLRLIDRRFLAFTFSDGYKSTMDWCSVYLTPQGLPKYIYLSPLLIFSTTYNGIRTKNAQCESLQALLPCFEWDRFVTLIWSKSGLRVVLSYLVLHSHRLKHKVGRLV